MKIDIETLRKTKGIGSKTLERIIEQHNIDNEIKAFESEYIPSDKHTLDKDITLWQGDCLELMNHIPDKSVDMILCDLPYGTTQCSWDEVIPFEPLWSHYKRIIKDSGAIVLFGSEPFSTKLRMSNLEWYRYDWKWKKSKASNFLLAKKQPLKNYEDIMIFYNSLGKYNPIMTQGEPYAPRPGRKQNEIVGHVNNHMFRNGSNDGKRYPKSIQYFKTAESEGATYHPTQKPVALLEYLIKTYTNENMLVLDNTMGSGSTGVASKNTNRRFIGIELDKEYYNIAQERIGTIK